MTPLTHFCLPHGSTDPDPMCLLQTAVAEWEENSELLLCFCSSFHFHQSTEDLLCAKRTIAHFIGSLLLEIWRQRQKNLKYTKHGHMVKWVIAHCLGRQSQKLQEMNVQHEGRDFSFYRSYQTPQITDAPLRKIFLNPCFYDRTQMSQSNKSVHGQSDKCTLIMCGCLHAQACFIQLQTLEPVITS